MNTQEYISSGILESYVLGLTNVQETAEVEQKMQQNPAIKVEIEGIQAALEEYALENAQTPPEYLKDKIWENIKKTDKTIDQNPFKSVSKNSQNNYSFLRIAASVLLVSSVAANLFLFNRWKNTKEELTLALTQNSTIAQEAKYSKESNLALNKQLDFLAGNNFKIMKLAGQKVAPNAKLLLAWNQTDKKVYVLKSDLPAAPTGKQYQLWAIVDKKPVDLGVFDQKEGSIEMKSVPNAQLFAVTLEKTGGNPTPTSELYVAGGAE